MRLRSLAYICLVLAVPLLLFGPFTSHEAQAQTAAEIQQQINDHNQRISDLEAEISSYQKQLDALGTQHATLATSIKSLDVTRAQLTAKIKALQQQIASLTLELKQLANQIALKQQSISLSKQTLAKSLRDIADTDNASVVEQIFASNNLSDAWAAVDSNVSLNDALRTHTEELGHIKQELTSQQQAVAQTQQKLVTVTTDLGTQKQAADVTAQQKALLLAQTKNQESSYQQLISTKRAQQKAFESELNQLEGQLKSVGVASIPHPGSGILSWPFSDSLMQGCANRKNVFGNPFCVTQYFGNTAFAASGAYNGKGHNGIDIGVPTGTPIEASLTGTVMGTGNTDLVPGCYSFGKWVAIKHANGLATVYGHLSQINVSKGQSVNTGDVIGYSGMTGYATGPHLHFGVYAVGTPDAPGIQIMTLSAYRGATSPCANATMPVAPLNAYLNPISYL